MVTNNNNGNQRRRRRRRNRRNRVGGQPARNTGGVISIPNQQQPRRRRRGQRRAGFPIARMSAAGEAFLKCATSSPDFNIDPGRGIPDKFNGKVLMRKHALTQTVSFTAGKDTYLVFAPTPGVAYWKLEKDTGVKPTPTDEWSPVKYPRFDSLFSDVPADRTKNVEQFRYASMTCGLYPTSNITQASGSVSVWKIPLAFATAPVTTRVGPAGTGVTVPLLNYAVNGMEGVTALPSENYTHAFLAGAYAASYNNEDDFPFRPVMENIERIPVKPGGSSAIEGTPPGFGVFNGDFLGLGTMDAIVLLVASPTGAVNNGVIKAWSCVEYRPTPSSAFYEDAGCSPDYDPIALAVYSKMKAELPIAVAAGQNADFWNRVLNIIRTITGALSKVPGPVGYIATGVDAITSMMTRLSASS